MDRVKAGGYSALLEAAYARIPVELHRWIRPDFFCGSDPVFAGLHSYEDTVDERSYHNIAHVVHPYHQWGISKANRCTTVVLPRVASLSTLVHELGHVLDDQIARQVGKYWNCKPVTQYAQTDGFEAFAEAFSAWILGKGPEGYGFAHDRLYERDRKTVAFFEELLH